MVMRYFSDITYPLGFQVLFIAMIRQLVKV
jgi:hypothetical protein